MVRNTRYVLVSLINEDRPGVLKYTHLYITIRYHTSHPAYPTPSYRNRNRNRQRLNVIPPSLSLYFPFIFPFPFSFVFLILIIIIIIYFLIPVRFNSRALGLSDFHTRPHTSTRPLSSLVFIPKEPTTKRPTLILSHRVTRTVTRCFLHPIVIVT